MIEWMIGLVERGGYAGIGALMFIENLFPPIPSELVMPLAGFAAARDQLSLLGVILAGLAGSLLGALPWYWLGKAVGHKRLGDLADRHGRWLTVGRRDLDRATRWFDRHQGRAVFFGRLVPAVRTLVSIPAGVARMRLDRFLFWTALGTGLWSAALASAGFLLEGRYTQVAEVVDPIAKLVLGLLAALYLYRVIRMGPAKLRRREPEHRPARRS